ncbi:MAG: 6-phosphofructokinase [Verrucomicrobiae bacterium]|nr:6-phosphofructokinase [Verrucomicrobiae bacterium]MCX7723018.1 6-phosphofructokinase [Verrucomicrobiae bacterium]MDW7981113.1 6-phosphofructokinase [Verrucomicrobiales bacterium]
MAKLKGNLLVAQSGGPTPVINASVAGVVEEAARHNCIEQIYGGLNGILGILNEELVNLRKEKRRTIEQMKFAPGAALGTCRYKLHYITADAIAAAKDPEKRQALERKQKQGMLDMDRLFDVFKAHNIRYFLYIGGNDSQDTSHKIHTEAQKRGYELRVIGVPKTIDNDLPFTDNCPGYGSVVKYNATTVMEVGMDVASMATDEGACCIIEVMGRSAGWIAAGTVLAKRGDPANPPHIILLPELLFEPDPFIAKVKETIAAYNYCIVVVGEGIRWKVKRLINGVEKEVEEEIGADPSRLDAFGHPYLMGAGLKLKEIVEERLKTKTRTVLLGYAQRAASHCASLTDVKNAHACGVAAVKAAVAGKSGFMVTIVRNKQRGGKIKWTTGLHPLEQVANVEHLVPRDWISPDGFMPNEKFIEYVRPLVEGEVKLPFVDGLPQYAVLQKVRVPKQLPARTVLKTK